MRIEHGQNLDEIRPVGEQWLKEQNASDFGLKVDFETIVKDLEGWLEGEGTILVAMDGVQPVGFLAVFALPSYLGPQKIALEKYWYTMTGHHTAGPRLLCEALKWAKEHGCSHLIMSASNLASNMHDQVCEFYQRMGFKPFESSFICET